MLIVTYGYDHYIRAPNDTLCHHGREAGWTSWTGWTRQWVTKAEGHCGLCWILRSWASDFQLDLEDALGSLRYPRTNKGTPTATQGESKGATGIPMDAQWEAYGNLIGTKDFIDVYIYCTQQNISIIQMTEKLGFACQPWIWMANTMSKSLLMKTWNDATVRTGILRQRFASSIQGSERCWKHTIRVMSLVRKRCTWIIIRYNSVLVS